LLRQFSKMDYLAHVTKDIADLIPTFLENRKSEAGALLLAIRARDLARIVDLGERMYAVGNPYGFRQITTFGRLIREAMAAGDINAVRNVVRTYDDYLARVQVVFVDAPVPRPQWTNPVIETKIPSDPRPLTGRATAEPAKQSRSSTAVVHSTRRSARR
jgi:hypothetical protein